MSVLRKYLGKILLVAFSVIIMIVTPVNKQITFENSVIILVAFLLGLICPDIIEKSSLIGSSNRNKTSIYKKITYNFSYFLTFSGLGLFIKSWILNCFFDLIAITVLSLGLGILIRLWRVK